MEIEKSYFTLPEILERWSMSGADFVYLAENDQLRLSIRVFNLAVEFGVERGGTGHVAVGAQALDAHPLAEQVKLDGRVAFGGAEADADGAFHGYALQSAVV